MRAAGGRSFKHIGDDITERIAYKPAQFVRIRLVRRKDVPIDDDAAAPTQTDVAPSTSMLIAPLPDNLWPRTMADPSAVSHVIVSKYDDVLPLHRQERISHRSGFILPRSTQCGWLGAAYDVCYRVVDAMFAEAKARAFCIATDATSAPVCAPGACASWTIFVFIADRDHVVFRYAHENTSAVVSTLLRGFRGHLLADAAPVYDVLYRGGDVVEHVCWFQLPPLLLPGPRVRASAGHGGAGDHRQALRGRPGLPRHRDAGAHRGPRRRDEAVLALFDKWIDSHRDRVDPGGCLDKAIGYDDNQREVLHRFLADGRIRLDNNISEGELRNVSSGSTTGPSLPTRLASSGTRPSGR